MSKKRYNNELLNCEDHRYNALNKRYKRISGEDIPLMMIPDGETFADMDENIRRCEAAGKDLFPEIYQWKEGVFY